MAFLKNLYASYVTILQAYPYPVQAVQTGILMGAGDLIAQKLRDRRAAIDKKRILRFSSIGFFFYSDSYSNFLFKGPVVQFWYTQLSRIKGKNPGVVALKKICLDQILAAPVLLYCVLSMVCFLNGHPLNKRREHVHQKFLPVLLGNYKVWPAVQLVNFYFVPLNYQIPFTQLIGIMWNSYLSYKAHSAAKPEEVHEHDEDDDEEIRTSEVPKKHKDDHNHNHKHK